MPKRVENEPTVGGWRLGACLGKGGNGVVHVASRGDLTGAIKVSTRRTREGYERFRAEIEAMNRCADIPGVLPLLDSHCPPSPPKAPHWFVMGLAKLIKDALGADPSMSETVEACAQIATTLSAMHARGVAHRDLKPENLFRYEGRYAVGDFGLVDFPGKTHVTAAHTKLGPVYYIAPEMLNTPQTANGSQADVYSFAKTMWVLLTGQTFPVPGVLAASQPTVALRTYVRDPRATLLDRLLESATQVDPRSRPTMEAIANELKAWLHPRVSQHQGPLDLSDLSPAIAGLNARQQVELQRVKDNQHRIDTDGVRLRERLRPVANRLQHALTEAKFLDVRLDIDSVAWGFMIGGYVLARVGLGEATLKLFCAVEIPGELEGPIPVRYTYSAATNFGRSTERNLAGDVVTFWPGGSLEETEMNRLIENMIRDLTPSAEEVLRLAIGSIDAQQHP